MATFYAAGGPGGLYNPQEFLSYLDRTYKDSNVYDQAASTLRTLRQREDQALASFLPRFERILAEAGGADWPSRAKITLLEGALSVKLRKALIGHIAVWCPRLKRSYPAKAKKVKKVKKAARPKESSSSATEELGSSETEESLGKE
ncbi:pol-like protein [Colletotrichum kahawae]|uniref:Pol-like protein n=1 Tax=Colletotrichum kahawae TaxID=34407 RepID=A0AAE0CWN6_COLKA|nr:pol-like protein [Colletotrichum kahawae]